MSNIKVIDLAKEGMLLPPAPGLCVECATKHEPEMPHNRKSLHYMYYFYNKNGRFPNWKDAMIHCEDKVKEFWIDELTKAGENLDVQ